MSSKLKYKRILLKLSGEVLGGDKESGLDFRIINDLVKDLKKVVATGVEIAIVVGGGNIWRYRDFKDAGLDRVSSDYLGMLATFFNAVALRELFERNAVKAEVLSAFPMKKLTMEFSARKANHLLKKGRVVICAGGTGNPFCSTDTAAALRAGELQCDLIVKGSNVDYLYDADPRKNPKAKPIPKITFDEVLAKGLTVMDLSAIALAKEAAVPVAIFNLNKPKNLLEILSGKNPGTIIY